MRKRAFCECEIWLKNRSKLGTFHISCCLVEVRHKALRSGNAHHQSHPRAQPMSMNRETDVGGNAFSKVIPSHTQSHIKDFSRTQRDAHLPGTHVQNFHSLLQKLIEMFPDSTTGCCYEDCKATADWLLAQVPVRPLVGIVCGSGLGGLAEMLKDQLVINYADIPNFPRSTGSAVHGHAGNLVFGTLKGKPCVCMQGRFHLYEGYNIQKTTMPIRVFKLLGVETVLLTNAAGGLNQEYSVGDIMIIKDHINIPGFAGNNPLVGPNDERFGTRFPCMSDVYDRDLQQLAHEVATELGYSAFMQEGVYSVLGGPSYETIAECRMLRSLGADAVGMSTVHEVIVARHCGMKVFALSLITNQSVMDYDSDKRANHEEVLRTAEQRARQLEKLIANMVSRMDLRNNEILQ